MCNKVGHSCERKEVSYVTLWGRGFFREIHRAAPIIIETAGGWEVWNPSDSPRVLRRRISLLRRHPDYETVCAKCGKEKEPGLAQVVSDAGQFYGQSTAGSAIADFKDCSEGAEHIGRRDTVTIRLGPSVEGKMGGGISDFVPRGARVLVFRASEVVRMFEVIVRMVLVALGDTLYRLPHCLIGFPFGEIAVSARAAVCELTWLQQGKNIEAGEHLTGWLWVWYVATARYVDDLYMSGFVLCAACLTQMPEKVYPFQFDVSCEGTQVV